MGCRPFADNGHDGVIDGPVSGRANLHDFPRPRMDFDGRAGGARGVAGVVCQIMAHAEDRRTARAAAVGIAVYAMAHGPALLPQGVDRVKFLDPPGGVAARVANPAGKGLATEQRRPARGGQFLQFGFFRGGSHLGFGEQMTVGLEQPGGETNAVTDEDFQRQPEQLLDLLRAPMILRRNESVSHQAEMHPKGVVSGGELRGQTLPAGMIAKLRHSPAGQDRRLERRRGAHATQLGEPDRLHEVPALAASESPVQEPAVDAPGKSLDLAQAAALGERTPAIAFEVNQRAPPLPRGIEERRYGIAREQMAEEIGPLPAGIGIGIRLPIRGGAQPAVRIGGEPNDRGDGVEFRGMKIRKDPAAGLQDVKDGRANGFELRQVWPAKRRHQDMTMTTEAMVANATRRPRVAAKDDRHDRFLWARQSAPVMGIHFSAKQKVR